MKKTRLWCAAIVIMALSHASQAQILIGQTAGFTGPLGAGVKETTEGAKLYLIPSTQTAGFVKSLE